MEQFVREIQKRDDCVIRIKVDNLAGYRYIEIRQYYRDEHNDFKPSKKGITFSTSHIDELIEYLHELKRHLTQNP